MFNQHVRADRHQIEFNDKLYYTERSLKDPSKRYLLEHDQPVFYPKYGCMEVRNGFNIVEYVRYNKVKGPGSRSHLPPERFVPKPSAVFSSVRRTDTSFDPATAPSRKTATLKYNHHLFLGVLLGQTITKEAFEAMSTPVRNQLYLDAAQALVTFVEHIVKKKQEIMTIQLKRHTQKSNRKVFLILWRTVATHLRVFFKRDQLSFSWQLCKFVADHHPQALLRSVLRFSELEMYAPTIKVEEVTLMDLSTDRKRSGLHYTGNLHQFPHMADYVRWFRKKYPVRPAWVTPDQKTDKATLKSVRGSLRYCTRDRDEIYREIEVYFDKKETMIPYWLKEAIYYGTSADTLRKICLSYGVNTVEKGAQMSYTDKVKPIKKGHCPWDYKRSPYDNTSVEDSGTFYDKYKDDDDFTDFTSTEKTKSNPTININDKVIRSHVDEPYEFTHSNLAEQTTNREDVYFEGFMKAIKSICQFRKRYPGVSYEEFSAHQLSMADSLMDAFFSEPDYEQDESVRLFCVMKNIDFKTVDIDFDYRKLVDA